MECQCPEVGSMLKSWWKEGDDPDPDHCILAVAMSLRLGNLSIEQRGRELCAFSHSRNVIWGETLHESMFIIMKGIGEDGDFIPNRRPISQRGWQGLVAVKNRDTGKGRFGAHSAMGASGERLIAIDGISRRTTLRVRERDAGMKNYGM
jgi:hypothetical protein